MAPSRSNVPSFRGAMLVPAARACPAVACGQASSGARPPCSNGTRSGALCRVAITGSGRDVRVGGASLQKAAEPARADPGGSGAPEQEEAGVAAVIFDMDGVLCESEGLSRSVGAQVLRELHGLDVAPEEFIPFVGTGEANFLGGVAAKRGVELDTAAAKQRFFELYLEAASQPGCSIGYPGARELVLACRRAGLRTAVASSADRVKVDANLRAAGFDAGTDFDAIVTADAFARLKPAPDVFLAAAAAVGVQPERCVVVEDAPAGIAAARAAGMRCVGVATSLSREALETHGPDTICPDISHVSLAALLSLRSAERRASGRDASTSAPAERQASGWLEAEVALPGGYRTRRRELLKLFPLFGAAGAGYALAQNAQTLSYVSPRALLNALTPSQVPAASHEEERVAAFVRYIESKEARRALEAVPEFSPGLTWFNSPPLRLDRELRGKVVILDFWTFCCINCMHVLPELARLEERYAGQAVAVVGVHSAKFDAEKDDSSIRAAILRYEVRHPCVNDAAMTLWRQLGISSWPTLAIVSPRGDLIATLPGEGQEATVDAFIQAALQYYGERGELDASPLPQALERDRSAALVASPLRFPGKLAFDAAGGRLFISDSGNNRIVVTDARGRFLEQVGGRGAGQRDGGYAEAAFHRPQGLAFCARSQRLFVADTENHALRCVDLAAQRVRTLAGNGAKGSDYMGGGSGRAQQLNSPWDLALDREGEQLYIAMAGQHQIWRHDLASGATAAFSGTGAERNANGAAASTAWAQPSGLALSADGRHLFVADSESSSVRSLSLTDGSSQSHVGGDGIFADNLFRFGDRDGVGSDARLQHPLAVATLLDGRVLVADSYNHRLKVLDPATDRIISLAGSGRPGFANGRGVECALSEPGGLAVGPEGTVLVADTNNSLIRVLDPAQGSLTTLQLKGVPSPRASPDTRLDGGGLDEPLAPGVALVALDPVQAASGELRLRLDLPPGYRLTQGATSRASVAVSDGTALAVEPRAGELTGNPPTAALRFRRLGSGAARARVMAAVYFCREADVCLLHEVAWDVPFAAAEPGAGNADVLLTATVPASAPVTAFP